MKAILVIDMPMTDEELQREFEEQLKEFRRMGLIPVEESDVEPRESEETE